MINLRGLIQLYQILPQKQTLELRQFIDQRLTDSEEFIKKTNLEYINYLKEKYKK